MTACLSDFYRVFGYADIWCAEIESVLHNHKLHNIFDLCSGSGGVYLDIAKKLACDNAEKDGLSITLSDIYPPENFQEISYPSARVSYQKESVNALDCETPSKSIISIIAGFHHFKPEQAKNFLRHHQHSRNPILVIEPCERGIIALLTTCILPLVVLALTPFSKNLSLGRMFFTYLIPVVPLAVGFDGFISMLRSYKKSEIAAMAKGTDYVWHYKRVRPRLSPITSSIVLFEPITDQSTKRTCGN